jgi:ATP-binding cassette subfamily B protein
MHALGHALMALVASALALSVATMWAPSGPSRGTPLALLPSPFSGANGAFSFALAGLAVVVLKGIAGVYATYVQVRTAGRIGCTLRLELLDALLCLHRVPPPRQTDQSSCPSEQGFHRSSSGAAVALTDLVKDIEAGLSRGLLAGIRAVAQLVPIAALLVALSPRMAGAAAIVLGGFGWALGRTRSWYRRASVQIAREQTSLHEAADEAVRHAELWVTFGAEIKVRANVRRLGNTLARGSAWLEARAATMSAANEVLAALALVLAVGAGRAGVLGERATGGVLLGFAVAFFLAYRPLRELSDARLAMTRAEASYGELVSVIDRARVPTDLAETDEPSDRTFAPAALELRHLRLARGKAGPISMRVERGAVAVVTGATAVGKTTLLRTLLGLERPLSGDVVFGGVSLHAAPAGPRSRPFAWVPQEAPVLADTLAANVALGAPSADARDALEPLGATSLASQGDERVGAGGRALSGGERQWVALARAIATQQPVLLLDEPTSGLDADAQQAVLAAIARLRGRRTVILVTHRLEPLAIADIVVRLEDSGAIERAA